MTENKDRNKPSASTNEIGTSSPSENLESSSAQTFGEWLRNHRTIRRISLEEIAAVTKVHIMQLRALEENDIGKLPAPAFVRGFLVSYARHLGIDENEVLNRYKNSFGGSLTPIADLLTPSKNRSARSASAPKVAMVSSPQFRQSSSELEEAAGFKLSALTLKNIAIAVGAISLAVLFIVLISLGKNEKQKKNPDQALAPYTPTSETSAAASSQLGSSQPETVNRAAKPSSNVETPAIAANTSVKTKDSVAVATTTAASTTVVTAHAAATTAAAITPTTTAKTLESSSKASVTAPKKYQLEVKAIEPNYVHLRIDDDSPRGLSLKAAQTQIIDVAKKAVLTISDAGNLEVRWNGVWYSSLGYRGDLKVITLPDQLSTLTPKSAGAKTASKPKAKAASNTSGDNLLTEVLEKRE